MLDRRQLIGAAVGGSAALIAAAMPSVAHAGTVVVTTYKIRNSTGKQVTIGVFGEDDPATLRKELTDGGILTIDLFGGDRVFVAWDDFSDKIVAIDHFVVSDGRKRFDYLSNGTIEAVATASWAGD